MRRAGKTAAVALAVFAAACSGDGTGSSKVGPPATVAASGGTSQTATVGVALPTQLTIHVADAKGRAVAGVPVTWAVTSGGGSIVATGAATDASGNASASWTLGTIAGTQGATATVSGLTAVAFTATATAGPVAAVTLVSGGNQLAVRLEQQAQPLVFRAVDQYNNPAAGQTLQFSVTGGSTATVVSPVSAATGADGTAATYLRLGDELTARQVRVTAAAAGATAQVTGSATFYSRSPVLTYTRANTTSGAVSIYALEWKDGQVGGRVLQLTPSSEDADYGTMSPDGSLLAYSRFNSTTGHYDLVTRGQFDGVASTVYSSPTSDAVWARFSAGGDSIFFTVFGSTTAKVAMYVRHNGALVADVLGSSTAVFAVPAPSGGLLYSQLLNPGQYDLAYRAIGAGATAVTSSTTVDEYGPSFLSATRMVYTCDPLDAQGGFVRDELCAINVDGTGYQSLLSEAGWNNGGPTISRNGQWIAFYSYPDDGSVDADIYFARTSGGTVDIIDSSTFDDEWEPMFGLRGWNPPGTAPVRAAVRAVGPSGRATPEARARLARYNRIYSRLMAPRAAGDKAAGRPRSLRRMF
ncbi:MAG TPA: hypothetical protein VFJ82_23305 [Longimicrobium sp.]|nr:hypothetical protein [Longimicrobium sp.]